MSPPFFLRDSREISALKLNLPKQSNISVLASLSPPSTHIRCFRSKRLRVYPRGHISGDTWVRFSKPPRRSAHKWRFLHERKTTHSRGYIIVFSSPRRMYGNYLLKISAYHRAHIWCSRLGRLRRRPSGHVHGRPSGQMSRIGLY